MPVIQLTDVQGEDFCRTRGARRRGQLSVILNRPKQVADAMTT
jgi:hypothetical protein